MPSRSWHYPDLDDVAGLWCIDPVVGVEGDADVAVVVDWATAAKHEKVASLDGLRVPVDWGAEFRLACCVCNSPGNVF